MSDPLTWHDALPLVPARPAAWQPLWWLTTLGPWTPSNEERDRRAGLRRAISGSSGHPLLDVARERSRVLAANVIVLSRGRWSAPPRVDDDPSSSLTRHGVWQKK